MQTRSRRAQRTSDIHDEWASRLIDLSETSMTDQMFHYINQYERLAPESAVSLGVRS